MATTYVKFTNDEGREAGVKQLFGLDRRTSDSGVHGEGE